MGSKLSLVSVKLFESILGVNSLIYEIHSIYILYLQNKVSKKMYNNFFYSLKGELTVLLIEFDRWSCYSYSLIRIFGVFGGGLIPIKTTLLPFPAMQNVAWLVIVVSLGK